MLYFHPDLWGFMILFALRILFKRVGGSTTQLVIVDPRCFGQTNLRLTDLFSTAPGKKANLKGFPSRGGSVTVAFTGKK